MSRQKPCLFISKIVDSILAANSLHSFTQDSVVFQEFPGVFKPLKSISPRRCRTFQDLDTTIVFLGSPGVHFEIPGLSKSFRDFNKNPGFFRFPGGVRTLGSTESRAFSPISAHRNVYSDILTYTLHSIYIDHRSSKFQRQQNNRRAARLHCNSYRVVPKNSVARANILAVPRIQSQTQGYKNKQATGGG